MALASVCPFCALRFPDARSECPRCGMLLGAAAEDLHGLGGAERTLLRSRKAISDTLFLIGLLLGGPISTIGDRPTLGGFIVLAGGGASVLRRHTTWSLPGTVVIGSLLAALAAALVVEPGHRAMDDLHVGEDARLAYAAALDKPEDDVGVEARGADAVAIWFTLPQSDTGECGAYPATEVRAHLAALGFLRVVVAVPNQAGGLCSFVP